MDDFVPVIFGILAIAVCVAMIAGIWKVFVKAGQPGWGCLVPIYNLILLLGMAGKPTWWIVLFLIPLVSLVAAVLVSIEIAKKFGQGTGYGLGLAFLPMFFFPMLGFGSAQYQGAKPA
ncbi:MAG: signal peptidase I [Bryobacterales bacterium]|nr:signal peptidase I [Bryobacterales bacterium]